jgi:hypothetical protein
MVLNIGVMVYSLAGAGLGEPILIHRAEKRHNEAI